MSDEKELVCPGCEATFMSATNCSGQVMIDAPPLGSIGMCAECGLDIVYMGTHLRLATMEEIKALPAGLREEAQALARELGFQKEIDITDLVVH